MSKRRITITVDEDMLDAANGAVATGHADPVSDRVGKAMTEHLETERRLVSLAALVSDDEAEHGAIGETEVAEQDGLDRIAAAISRSRRVGGRRVDVVPP